MRFDTVAIAVKDAAACWEALRSALALAMEGKEVGLLLLCPGFLLPEGVSEADFEETMEMLGDDMGGAILARDPAWSKRFAVVRPAGAGEISGVIDRADLVIPFG